MTEPDRFRTLIGAYVTASLDPDERVEVERHLRGCGDCRDEPALLAPLPAILRRLPPPGESCPCDAAIRDAMEPRQGTEHARLALAAASSLRCRRRSRVDEAG